MAKTRETDKEVKSQRLTRRGAAVLMIGGLIVLIVALVLLAYYNSPLHS